MVWQYINFPTLTTLKKGLLLTVIRIQGTAEARRCGAVAVRSQVITWSSTLTLYALYLPRLPPPLSIPAPPLLSQARVLITTLVTLTRGIKGCPKTVSFDKSTWHPTFEKISPIFFFFAAWHPCIFATPFAKKCTPSFISHQPESPFPVLSFVAVFSPFLNKCQLLMPKDFLEPPC